jgi:hypothetical protein
VNLHDRTFYFGKTCAETLNFSLPKKLGFKKNQTFGISPVVFAPRTQAYATELKEWTIVDIQ